MALGANGELRTALTHDELADIVWSMNGPEYGGLLVDRRGRTPDRFGRRIADAWARIQLKAGAPRTAS